MSESRGSALWASAACSSASWWSAAWSSNSVENGADYDETGDR
jgi:hypothetical protein